MEKNGEKNNGKMKGTFQYFATGHMANKFFSGIKVNTSKF